MKQINLSRGQVALVDDEDFAFLNQWKWSCKDAKGYVHRNAGTSNKRRNVMMHRLLLNAPPGTAVDHIDGNPLNNQKSNLRLATKSENGCNRSKNRNNTSGYKGIRQIKSSKKWQARICKDGILRHIGCFDTAEEAAAAYAEAAKELHGDFARS